MECKELLEEVEQLLWCMHVGSSTGDPVEHTFEVLPYSKTAKRITVKEFFGVKPIDSIAGGMDVVRFKHGLEALTNSWHWPHQSFNVNRSKKTSH